MKYNNGFFSAMNPNNIISLLQQRFDGCSTVSEITPEEIRMADHFIDLIESNDFINIHEELDFAMPELFDNDYEKQEENEREAPRSYEAKYSDEDYNKILKRWETQNWPTIKHAYSKLSKHYQEIYR